MQVGVLLDGGRRRIVLSELLDGDSKRLWLHHVLLRLELRSQCLLLSLQRFNLLLQGVLFNYNDEFCIRRLERLGIGTH